MGQKSIDRQLNQAPTEELLAHATDVLGVAAQKLFQPGEQRANINQELAALIQVNHAQVKILDRLARDVRNQYSSGGLTVVDGVFAGDAENAVDTTVLWLLRGDQKLREVSDVLSNAHIAAGGLAENRDARPVDQPRERSWFSRAVGGTSSFVAALARRGDKSQSRSR